MITKAQREQRRSHIGSSDISAIMGVNPFVNAYEIYLSKIHEMDDYVPGESAEIGNYLEDDIIEWVANKYNLSVSIIPADLHYICKEHPLFACNLDAVAVTGKGGLVTGLEAKYTSLIDEWGTGEETIPDHFMLQVQHQMLCTGFEYIVVGVWIAYYGIERRHYVIKRNQKMINQIAKYGEWFWNKHVIPKVPPSDSPLPIPKTFSRIPKVKGKVIDIGIDAWGEYEAVMAESKEAGKKKKVAQSKIRAAMGNAEALRLPDGRFYGQINNRYRVYKGEE